MLIYYTLFKNHIEIFYSMKKGPILVALAAPLFFNTAVAMSEFSDSDMMPKCWNQKKPEPMISQQFPQTRFRLAHFQLIKNDFIEDE